MTYNYPLQQFENKDIVFVGEGKGRASIGVKTFLENHAKINSYVGVDKQPGEKPLDFLNNYDLTRTVFIKNEGIPGNELHVPYITQMQLFFELIKLTHATTVGITGTKGKSTTTSLTAHILESAGKNVVLAGNIGVSPLLSLDSANQDTIFVLELSSYQLSDLTVSPHISACLNLYNDHTDWHGSLEAYWEAKHNIMRFAKPEDIFIYNPTFPALQAWAKYASCKTIAINPEEQLDLLYAKLFGDHNRLNALIAKQIALEFNVPNSDILSAINSFEPLRHRMQVVTTKNNLTFIDDAIGMTPESTIASLKAIGKKFGHIGCLLLGGKDRNYDFTEVMGQIADLKIPNLVLFPDTTSKMRNALPAGYQPNIFESTNMAEAVNWANTNAPKPSVVLLSTAAPSYSLWKDFEDKGDQFQVAVNSL